MLLTSRLDDARSTMEALPLMLRQRAAKRCAQQRRRAERKREQEAQEASRQAKHLHIDEWRRQRQDEVERAKRVSNYFYSLNYRIIIITYGT